MTITSLTESNGMMGRDDKEYGSEFDDYEEEDDDYEEVATYSEITSKDDFDFEGVPESGLATLEEEPEEEELEEETDEEFTDPFTDPFSDDDDDDDDLDF